MRWPAIAASRVTSTAGCATIPDLSRRLPLVQAKSHILSFALRGMDETTRAVLDTVAAFRMPASYDTLAALLVGPDRRFADEAAFDAR